MNEDPLIILIYCAIAIYIANIYRADIKAFVAGEPNVKALPGAKPTNGLLIFASVLGALVLLGNAVVGEYALGIVEAQSEMVWFFVFASISAGVIEEVVFRGYLVVQNRGRNALVLSCLGFSLVFALVHGYLWSMEDGFAWNFTVQGFSIPGSYFLIQSVFMHCVLALGMRTSRSCLRSLLIWFLT